MNKKIRAEFTVEAALLVPVLLLLIIVAGYLVIYSYDRALMYQDINALAAEYRITEDDFRNTCNIIKEKRPYMGVDGPFIYVNKAAKTVEITMKCDWAIPVLQGSARSIVVKREISTVTPIEIMRMTNDILSEVEGINEK